MSYLSSLENRNRVVRATVSSPPSQGATTIALTVGPLPPFAKLKRLIITADNNIMSLTATVVSDGGLYLSETGVDKANLIMAQGTGNMTNNRLAFEFNDTYIEDRFRAGFYTVVLSASAIESATVFTTTMEVEALTPSSIDDQGRTCFMADTSWRVLRDTGSKVIDLSQNSRRNGNPYGLGPTNQSESFLAIGETTEYLYVGSAQKWHRMLALVPSYAQQIDAALYEISTDGGENWSTITPRDNTSDGQTGGEITTSAFSYSGVIELPSDVWDDVTPFTLDTDPVSVQEASIISSSTNSGAYLHNPERYWLRISIPYTNWSPFKYLKLVALQRVRE